MGWGEMVAREVRKFEFSDGTVMFCAVDGCQLVPLVEGPVSLRTIHDPDARALFLSRIMRLLRARRAGTVTVTLTPGVLMGELPVHGEIFVPTCTWAEVMFVDGVDLDWCERSLTGYWQEYC